MNSRLEVRRDPREHPCHGLEYVVEDERAIAPDGESIVEDNQRIYINT